MLLARVGACLSLAACLAIVGCGKGGDQRPTAPTTVTVTYNGNPVEGATVTFIPDEPPIQVSVGRTDAQGKAQMRTYGEADGAIVGSHKVTIIKTVITNEQPTAEIDSPEYDPEAGPPPRVERQLPARYGSPGSSELTAEITRGENEVSFELTD